MPVYRGIEGAAIVAKKAYEAYGWEATPEIIDAFYATLRGRSFKGALRAVERCFQHPGRIRPPTCSEVLGEILIEENEAAKVRRNDRVVNSYATNRPLTPRVFAKQLEDAKRKHPHLFDQNSGVGLTELVESVNARLKDPGGPDPWASAYTPGEDLNDAF